jgi:hypothetical protein
MNKSFLFFILFFSISIYSQKITGTITSEDSAIANPSDKSYNQYAKKSRVFFLANEKE